MSIDIHEKATANFDGMAKRTGADTVPGTQLTR